MITDEEEFAKLNQELMAWRDSVLSKTGRLPIGWIISSHEKGIIWRYYASKNNSCFLLPVVGEEKEEWCGLPYLINDEAETIRKSVLLK